MSAYFGKQNSSRPLNYQALAYAGNATSVPSTNFTAQTYQVRVVSEVQGWLAFGVSSTLGTTLSATVASSSLKISANAPGEYFAVSPNMMCAFNSTSTSTGFCQITEMS